MIRIVSTLGLLCLLSIGMSAVETATWTQSSAEDFEKGKRERVALRSDGTLHLAPSVTELLDASSNAIWAMATDDTGALYAASPAPEGGKVRVFRIAPGGTAETLADVEGLTAFALAVDAQRRVYVGISPQSKVYRIENGNAELFYTPPAEYIWQMAFGASGDLFVATGDKGVVYRVDQQGNGFVFFETEETHVRAMLLDAEDNLYIGTSPGALVMRITSSGEGFVLYQSDREEITALARDRTGNLYAAAVGAKRGSSSLRLAPAPLPPPTAPAAGAAPQGTQQPRPQGQAPQSPAAPRASLTGGSQVLRVDPNGFPTVVWESEREYVYALAFRGDEKLLAGTGNEGSLHEIEAAGKSTSLLKATADQITAILPMANGAVAFATSNIGKVFQAGPDLAEDGYFESEVFDSEFFAQWGRVSASGVPGSGSVGISVRSGNVNRPQKNWSNWSAPAGFGDEHAMPVPPSRYLQWRAEFKRGSAKSPELRAVRVAYRNRNLPPVIVATEPTPPNYSFPPRSLAIAQSGKITLAPLSVKARPASSTLSPALQGSALGMNYSKGHVGIRWIAEDANSDELRYDLEICPATGGNWLTLVEDLEEPQYSWDSTSWPDGRYQVRITVSDHKSNTPEEALSATEVTEAFLIDNTKPVIGALTAVRAGDGSAAKVTARWQATDALSPVRRAEYSLNGKDWIRVEPRNGLSDARKLEYELVLNPAPEVGSVFTVRVRDEFENESVASVRVSQ